MTPDSRALLIVDDEPNLRFALRLRLEEEGYHCEECANGLQALQHLQKQDYFAVICDVRMPQLDGLQLLERLRDKGVRADVILMSAFGSLALAQQAVRKGAWDYVDKPIDQDRLLLTLQRLQEHRSLEAQHQALRDESRGAQRLGAIVARSAAMHQIFETVRKVADYPTTVLLQGESGTGKEMIARALHDLSGRRNHPFVALNCGAVPETLFEAELFGHARGAFTDAKSERRGLFEAADGGTLFLDEIADLPLLMQVKLLRALQEGEIRRVGEHKPRPVNVRIITACATPLDGLVRSGRFREDLFYRLNVVKVDLPPLRQRPEDIPLLVDHFLQLHNKLLGRRVRGLSPQAMERLLGHDWPGNVRELQNVLERMMVLSDDDLLGAEHLPNHWQPRPPDLDTAGPLPEDDEAYSLKKAMLRLEHAYILRALTRTRGNRSAAARLLEISHRALLYKIKDYFPDGLPPEAERPAPGGVSDDDDEGQ